jgi:hypothetical protein
MPGVALASGAAKLAAPKAFASALNHVRQSEGSRADSLVRVKSGDTLIGLVKTQAAAQGVVIKPGQEMQLAQQVAQQNRIPNANWIFPGQQISFSSLNQNGQAEPQARVSNVAPAVAAPAGVTSVAQAPASGKSNHPILEKTLERAVSKGFIPALEKTAVYDKILQLANTHNFKPDDFARMTLMESDGMNPRASNQRCHGIIQFCDGSTRGAASAGYAANPRAILDLSVHKQLGLVDKYFEDVGLKNKGPAGLEDLYLSVLNPASRQEKMPTAPLNIPGLQSSYLYEGRDTSTQLTRQSIREGLLKNATERLGQMLSPSPRLQALRASKYSDAVQN